MEIMKSVATLIEIDDQGVAWITGPHQDPRIFRGTSQAAKRVPKRSALGLFSDRYRHVRPLLDVRAKDRRAHVPGRARKYYGALREIEHRG